MPISPARIAAYEVLMRIERDGAFSSVLLPQFEAGLSEKDRSLCHQIVLGVLRRKYLLDDVISLFSGRKKLDLEVQTSLRIGAFQILFLDRVPAHSAVNDSVTLVQQARKVSAKGFVNAILRKITNEPVLSEPLAPWIRTSHPEWLMDRWSRHFGEERAVSIANSNNESPRPTFRLTPRGIMNGIIPPADAVPSSIVVGAFIADRMPPELRLASENGDLYFQDEASQLVAGSVQAPPDGRLLDVCAAPGGKTTLIAARSDAMVVAGDLHQPRVKFLRENALRQGVPPIHAVRYNAELSLPFPEETFDTILLDAPCSGTGTIRNNPEIRYALHPDDIKRLSSKQLAILKNASKLLKKGGTLCYSTCSLEREENEDVVSAFLNLAGREYRLEAPAVEARFATDEGFLRTYPDRDGTDGFFLACLTRN